MPPTDDRPFSKVSATLAEDAKSLELTRSIDVEAATTYHVERAMKHLARTAALHEFDGDAALAGGFWMMARNLAHELGRDEGFYWVVETARRYADDLCANKAPLQGYGNET